MSMETSPGRSGNIAAGVYPAANTAAVVTLAAVTKNYYIVDAMQFSYDGDPTGGRLTVAIGGETVFDVSITKGGPGPIPIPPGLTRGVVNEACVVTLAAGGSNITGKLNLQYRSVQ